MLSEIVKSTVENLIKSRKTISFMESCTGGGISNKITNISGVSNIFEFSAVTYSNRYKIKMGVPAFTIDKYGVYSMEVACEMGKAISRFGDSDLGVGVTGKLNCEDISNLSGKNNIVYISIYDKKTGRFHNKRTEVQSEDREKNKDKVIYEVMQGISIILFTIY